MGRGGARSGAGRKPKGSGVVLEMSGGRRVHRAGELPPGLTEAEREAVQEPPAHLTESVKACWRELAGKAVTERTLVPGSMPGFEELCLRLARIRALDARIDQLGPASQEALPYLKERRGFAKDVNASLKDFKLTAFGKPMAGDKPKATAPNPWAQVLGQ